MSAHDEDRPQETAPDEAEPEAGSADPAAPVVVDARGLRCPLPVIRAAAVARDAAPGALLIVRWTDPAAEHDLPAWARMRGHAVVSTERHDDHGTTTIRLARSSHR